MDIYLSKEALQIAAGLQHFPPCGRTLLQSRPAGHNNCLLLSDVCCVCAWILCLQAHCIFHQHLTNTHLCIILTQYTNYTSMNPCSFRMKLVVSYFLKNNKSKLYYIIELTTDQSNAACV